MTLRGVSCFSNVLLLGSVFYFSGCASVQTKALPAMATGLEKTKDFYQSSKTLVDVVCSQDAQKLSVALVSLGVEPSALRVACADAAAGLVIGRDAVNTLVDVYDTLNENVGSEN